MPRSQTPTTPPVRGLAAESLPPLRSWVERAGWAGNDPFDVRSHPVYLTWARRAREGSGLGRVMLGLLYHTDLRAPALTRALLRTPRHIIPKGMGLFARAYLLLAEQGDEEAAAEAERRLAWLRENPAKSAEGVAWGYPFDWESVRFFPAGTPSAVVTCTVADAFRARFEQNGDGESELMGAATFVARCLRRTVDTPDHVCFSYTPEDASAVHNANVIAAELLTWAGQTFDVPEWQSLARRAFAYTIAHQAADGSWDYFGPEHPVARRPHIDPYHTGFVLRMLLRAYAATGEERYLDAARRGYAYFNATLLDDDVPRNTSDRRHPVDGHAVAETLLTHLAFRALDGAAASRAQSLLDWTNRHMRDRSGYYYYQWAPRRTNRVPMMRWVEGWMFLALVSWMTDEGAP